MQLRNIYDRQTLERLLTKEPFERKTISFYRYVSIKDPVTLRDQLYKEWSDLGVLGRIYLSQEGMNAQMNIPQPNLEAFRQNLERSPYFQGVPFKHAVDEGPSFIKLAIKVKGKLVADGLSVDDYDLTVRGRHLPPEEFNKAMENPDSLIVDMRNRYESRIGHFVGAITPDSDTFAEELVMVKELLQKQKGKKLLLYCTGGIRCEKASAYLLKQGFTDVNQLEGGIIAYGHAVKEGRVQNRFRGKNFVFDERSVEAISDDVISTCDQCENPSDHQINCTNQMCHVLFIQCQACARRWPNACSPECLTISRLPAKEQKARRRGNSHPTAKQSVRERLRPRLK